MSHADTIEQRDGAAGFKPQVYAWLAATSATSLVVADIVGVKLFHIEPLGFTVEHSTGMIVFPMTFVLTDILNEFYGKKAARRVVVLSFAMALLAFAVINIAQAMPRLEAPFNVREDAFQHVFGSAKIMYIASLAAYMLGSFADIVMFAWFKWVTKGRFIWLRATGSTIVSQFIDSFVVAFVAFSLARRLFPSPDLPPATFAEVMKMAATGYTLKFFIAILSTPVIYFLKWGLTRWFGLRPLPPERAIG